MPEETNQTDGYYAESAPDEDFDLSFLDEETPKK